MVINKEDHLGKRARRALRAQDEVIQHRHTDNRLNIVRPEQWHRPRQKIRLLPKNVAQEAYIEALEDPTVDIVIAMGHAGSGKTYLATLYAIQQLREGSVGKIVVTRPNIAVDDKDIGFLPGDIMKKMAPWTKPVLDVFEEHYGAREVLRLIEDNTIELVPMAYLRGRTFKNAIIILDEAQNTTPTSMLSALTRIGESSKMIVTGDIRQSDRGQSNGLSDLASRIGHSPRMRLCRFGKEHVERHPVITDILKIYGEE